MHFFNRQDAGRQLAEKLKNYCDKNTVIYALPRGGVVIGYEIAKALNVPLDIVVARKIGHPANPELAIAAVSENDEIIYDELQTSSVDKNWLEKAIEQAREEAQRRKKMYTAGLKHVPAQNKNAIIVDDGMATGLTMRAAVKSLRKDRPNMLIVAVPVAAGIAAKAIRKEADIFVALEESEYLGAVGSYYDEFSQVSDKEVIGLLKQSC